MSSAKFLEDPLEFAKKNAILPQLGLEDADRLKPKKVNPNLTVYQVKGGNRILFANIVAKDGAHNCFEVEFNPAQLTESWFPVYWLPWQYNKTYRITLKRSEKTTVWDKRDRLANPHVFFTGALSGCMVHIDGDPFEPTVYHSNARDLKHDPPPSKDDTVRWSMMLKAQAMNADVVAAQTKFPKGESHYARQHADAFLYTPHVANAEKLEKLRTRATEKLKADFVQPVPLGMVFGVKSQGLGVWTFYYQSLIQFIIQKNSKKHEVWVVRECKRFWPGADIQKPINIKIVED